MSVLRRRNRETKLVIMNIEVKITANSKEEWEEAVSILIAGVPVTDKLNVTTYTHPELVPETATPEKKTRSKAKAIEESPVQEEPARVVTPSVADPLAATPQTVVDPLAASPVVQIAVDPLAVTPQPAQVSVTPQPAPVAATPQPTQAAQPAEITLATIREKIGTMADKREKVKDLMTKYQKADGNTCERPPDLQPKDYASFYEALEWL